MSDLTTRERADYLLQCIGYLEGRVQFVDEKAERLLGLLTVIVALTGLVPAARALPPSPARIVVWVLALSVLGVLVAAVLRNVLLCIRPTATFFLASTGGPAHDDGRLKAAGRQLVGWFHDSGRQDGVTARPSLLWPTPRRAWERVDAGLREQHRAHAAGFAEADLLADLTSTHLRLMELVSRKYRYYDAANTAARSLLVLWLPLLLVVVTAAAR